MGYLNTGPTKLKYYSKPRIVNQLSPLKIKYFYIRPNLKNFSRVSNLRNMIGSTWNWIQCFEIRAGAQLKPVLVVQPRGLNSLNLAYAFTYFITIIDNNRFWNFFICTSYLFLPQKSIIWMFHSTKLYGFIIGYKIFETDFNSF